MATSRKPSPDKSSKYAVAASRGFSYYLPKPAQQDLLKALRQLPSPTQSIYDEHYRDLMCAKACAPESATAMAKFVTESFPMIAKQHNAFFRKMNEEIDSNEHEGYVPVIFPNVHKPEARLEEGNARKTGRSAKRKQTTASVTKPALRGDTLNKKAKIKTIAQLTTSLGPGPDLLSSPSPTHGPDADAPLSSQSQSNETEPLIDTTKHQDPAPLTPDSNHSINLKHATSPAHLDAQPHPTSPPSNTPPSPNLSTPAPTSTTSEHGLQSAHAQESSPRSEETSPRDPAARDTTTTPPQPPLRTTTEDPNPTLTAREHCIPPPPNPLADAATASFTSLSEEHSRRVAGRGRAGVYYDDVDMEGGRGRGHGEVSAALFRGDYWGGRR
ncbi:hypothetical protein ST47_g5221 [Ascochyta rabiei]|uniref:Uncharacterized protein n=2 Tax=Didymella rabiei TaxID=5454 RepID=A0A163EC77_DIDRA|nr:hypothetical protein ST47_g5221 [Ascochyta rabiei]